MDLPHKVYTAAWVFWALWFVVWETLAIIDNGENETLTGHIKVLMWQSTGRPTIAAFVVAPALVWLLWHFYEEARKFRQG